MLTVLFFQSWSDSNQFYLFDPFLAYREIVWCSRRFISHEMHLRNWTWNKLDKRINLPKLFFWFATKVQLVSRKSQRSGSSSKTQLCEIDFKKKKNEFLKISQKKLPKTRTAFPMFATTKLAIKEEQNHPRKSFIKTEWMTLQRLGT